MLTEQEKNDLVHAILTDKRLAILGNKAREAKFAEMRTKKKDEILVYIQEVGKQNDYKPVSPLPRVDFIARLREVFKK